MSKNTISKEYLETDFNEVVERLMPKFHAYVDEEDMEIRFVSDDFQCDDSECMVMLMYRLKNELAAQKILDIVADFNDDYDIVITVTYEKITDEFIKKTVIGAHKSKVVGTQHENRAQNHSNLSVGESVKLVREPDNIYDPFAISVNTLSGLKLGYLPTEDALDISTYLDNNIASIESAVVSHTNAYTKDGALMQRPTLEIELCLKAEEYDFTEDNFDESNCLTESVEKQSVNESENTDEFEIKGTALVEYLGDSPKVKIPEGITEIWIGAFDDKEFVEEIEFPSSIQELEDNPFIETKWYKRIKDTLVTAHDNIIVNFPVTEPKVEFPENTKAILMVNDSNKLLTDVSIPSDVKVLGPVFCELKKLKNVTLAEGIEELNGSFFKCSKIKEISLPSTVKKLDYAFKDCINLKSVKLPDSITEIGESAFEGCKKMTDIHLNSNLKSIGTGAFAGCTALTNVEIPDSVTKIGWSAFERCTALTSVEIPDSVTEIGWSAFECCTALTSVKIPSSVTEIGRSAFAGCTSLTSVEIPDSVAKIGDSAFEGCTALEAVMASKGYDLNNISTYNFVKFLRENQD